VDAHTAPKNADLGRAAFQETDVTEWKQLERMFQTALSHFGDIDIVVPGAGVYEPVSPLLLFSKRDSK
jgi:3-hydroxybutyrate dehydrogenase